MASGQELGSSSRPAADGCAKEKPVVHSHNYEKGAQVEYFSRGAQRWIPCEVTRVHPEGAVQISVKPGCWLRDDEIKSKLRASEQKIVDTRPPRTFTKGQDVDYYSTSRSKWVPCQVAAVDGDGRIQISIKPGFWLSQEEIKSKLRISGSQMVDDHPILTKRMWELHDHLEQEMENVDELASANEMLFYALDGQLRDRERFRKELSDITSLTKSKEAENNALKHELEKQRLCIGRQDAHLAQTMAALSSERAGRREDVQRFAQSDVAQQKIIQGLKDDCDSLTMQLNQRNVELSDLRDELSRTQALLAERVAEKGA